MKTNSLEITVIKNKNNILKNKIDYTNYEKKKRLINTCNSIASPVFKLSLLFSLIRKLINRK